MVDKNIGGLPVLREKALVGIITETDIFKVFISLFGALRPGVRVSASISGVKGDFAKVASAIFQASGNIVGLGFDEVVDAPEGPWEMTMKVQDIPKNKLVDVLKPVVIKIIDVRNM